MPDPIADITLGNSVIGVPSPLSGSIDIDATTGLLVSTTLQLNVAGVEVPLLDIALSTNPTTGVTTVTGNTLAGGLGTGVTLSFSGTNPPTVTTSIAALGAPVVNNTVSATAVTVCYCSGTLIRTLRGGAEIDVAVEDLIVGDTAVTAAGEYRAIRWIGHQTHRLVGPARPRAAWPVRVAAQAFGDNRPDRDLFLSPGHSVCVGLVSDVLVPVQELVNGSTIAYVEDAAEVTYWHIELDSHDVLIANNMPAESFLEMGVNRAVFVEGRGLGDPSAEAAGRTHADFCRRFVDSGPLLATLRDELALRAAELGWQPSRALTIRCEVDGRAIHGRVREGEAFFPLPQQIGEIRVATGMTQPSLRGEADGRRVGMAVYALKLIDVEGEDRTIDLDDPAIAHCFHAGERAEALHYRWSAGDIVLPASATAGLTAPLLLSLSYEASTLRGWQEPQHRPQKPTLRVVS